MHSVYLIFAVLGGTIFVCQFLLGLVGLGEHHDFGGDAGADFDHDFGATGDHGIGGHDSGGAQAGEADQGTGHDHAAGHSSATSWFVGVLSFRTIVAAMTFFGLAGLAANAQGTSPAGSFALALAAGVTALYLVAWTMRSLSRLRADGTARIENAVGEAGVVYLTIPAHKSGKGKVTVTLQGRTMEYEALTDESELPTGTAVRIVSVVDTETLVVEAATKLARSSHA